MSGGFINGFEVSDFSGSLTALSGSPYATSYAVAVHPNSNFVYVSSWPGIPSGNGNIIGYTYDPTSGTLAAMSTPTFATSADPRTIAISPSGEYLYVGCYNSDNINAFSVSAATGFLTIMASYAISPSTGILTSLSIPTIPTSNGPWTIDIDPSGKYLYVGAFYAQNINGYSINSSTGFLTQLPDSPYNPGTDVRALEIIRR